MPPTGAKPFPPSKKIQKADTEARGLIRYEDGSLGTKDTRSGGGQVRGPLNDGGEGPSTDALRRMKGKPRSRVVDKRTVKQKLADAQSRLNGNS
jgi:hypothetical protein